MKVLVEISDDQIVAAIADSIRGCLATSLPERLPMQHHHRVNLFTGLEFCLAANRVIEHFGGVPVDLASIQRFTST